MNEHTRGPIFVRMASKPVTDGDHYRLLTEKGAEQHDGRRMVQYGNYVGEANGQTPETNLANATLWAASPYLLRALKRLVRRLDKGDSISREWFGWDAARDAIRKAGAERSQ